MKRLATLWLLGFIVLWLNRDATPHDKQAVRQGINQLFNEPNQSNLISVANLPVYRVAANTNVTGWLLVISEAQLVNLKVSLPNVTVAKLNAWRDSHLDNPAHLRWARGDDWQQVVADNGLEPVPGKAPTP
jgi:hypothetical protein